MIGPNLQLCPFGSPGVVWVWFLFVLSDPLLPTTIETLHLNKCTTYSNVFELSEGLQLGTARPMATTYRGTHMLQFSTVPTTPSFPRQCHLPGDVAFATSAGKNHLSQPRNSEHGESSEPNQFEFINISAEPSTKPGTQ